MTTQFLNFDELVAPEAFSQQAELTTQYAARGATFSGVGGPGWEVLNDSGNFGIAGYSAPNFVAWNTQLTSASEQLTFPDLASNLTLRVGSTEGGIFTATAYDNLGQELGNATIGLTSSLQDLSLPYDSIASVQLTTTSSFGVLDDVQFEADAPASPVLVALDADGNLTISDSDSEPNNNQLSLTSDGSFLVFSDPSIRFSSVPTFGSVLSNRGKTLAIPLSAVTGSITVLSGGGDDTFIVDYSTTFTNTINFDGGAGGFDTLSIKATADTTYTPSDTTYGDGVIEHGDSTINFVGLEPVDFDFIGPGAFNLALTGPTDVVDIANGNTVVGVQPALILSGTTNGVAFETAHVRNATTITIDTLANGAGADTVTISSANNAHGNTNLTISTDNVIVNGPAVFTGALNVNVNGNMSSTAAGTISTGTGFTLTNGGGGSIFSGSIGGAGGFTKNGAGGVVYFDAANNYAGLTTINSGYLVARNSSALGTTAAGTVVNNPGTLQLENNGSNVDIPAGEALSIGGNGVGGTRGALANWSGNNTYNGPITLTSNSILFTNSGIIDLTGPIGGAGFGVTKTGGGSLTYSGTSANTYTGTTIVENGLFTLNKTGVVAVAGPVQMGGGAGNTNAPNFRMSQPNQFGSGVVMTGALGQANHARFDLQGNNQTLAGLDSTHQFLVVQNERLGGGGTTAPATLTLNGTGTYSFAGFLRDEDDGGVAFPLSVTKTAGGVQTFSGANVIYTGATTLNAGQLILFNATVYRSPTTVNSGGKLSWSGNANSQNNQTGATIQLNNGSTLENLNPNNWTVINGAVTVPAGASATINQNSNAAGAAGIGFFLDGGLKGTGTVTINAINAGSGVNMRNNNSTFAGTMIVNGIASTTVFAGSGIGVGGNTSGLQNADIQLNGTMELLNQGLGWANSASGDFFMGGLSGSGVMIGNFTGGGTTRVRLGNNNNGGVFSGTIADGSGNVVVLTKNGTGTQVLSGTNTYTSTTTIAGGVLQIGNNGASGTLGTGTVTITAPGNLTFNRTDLYAPANAVNGTGSLTQAGTGTTQLSGGGITYTGATTVNAGTLVLNNATGAASPATVNGATLEFAGTANVDHPAAFSLTLNNGSTLNKTNTGYDTFNSSNVTVNGTVAMNITNNGANNQLFIGGGGTGLTGSGTLNLTNTGTTTTGLSVRNGTNASRFAGTVNVTGGVLNVGGGASTTFDNSNVSLNGAILNLSGGFAIGASDASVKSLGGNIAGRVVLAGQTLTMGTNDGGGNFGGTISGTGAVIKTGTGTQILSGVNVYTGTTTIAGGSLKLQAPTVTLPSSIPGNTVWLDANDINNTGTNVANNTQIATWVNKAAGGAGNFTNANGSLPFVYTTGDTINGNALVHFWGGTLRNLTNFGNNVSVFYVGRMSGGSSQRLLSSVNNNWLLGYWNGGKDRDYWNNGGNLTGTAIDFNQHIYAGIGDGTTANAYNFDGAESVFDTRALGGGAEGPNGLQLGGWGTGPSEQSYGDVGEVLVFNAALSAAQRLQVQQYLQAKWSGVLPTNTTVNITAAGASLDLNGVNQTVGSITGVDGSEIKLGGGTLTTGKNDATTTFSGQITGAGNVSKIGTGTLTLAGSAANTYTGTTTVRQGTLILSKNANVVAVPGDIVMNNDRAPNMWMTADNQLGGTGVLSFVTEVNTPGGNARFMLEGTAQSLAGINQVANTTGARQGVVQNSEPGVAGPTNAGTSVLTLTGAGTYSFNGYLRNSTGVISIVKSAGAGSQTFAGDRISYTGATTVNTGTLVLSDTTAFNSVISNAGTVEFNAVAGFNLGAGVPLTGPGVYNKTGVGTLQFNGANQVIAATGQFNIVAGVLQNNNNSVNWSGNTANMDISAGAVLDLFADPVYVNRLTGLGTVRNNFGNTLAASSAGVAFTERLYVGVAGGSSTFAGVISNNTSGSTGATGVGNGLVEVQKMGAGTLTLSNTNTYSGVTNIVAGAVEATVPGALGTTGLGTIVRNAGSLLLTNVAITGESLIIDSQSTSGAAHLATTGTSAWNGPISWNGSTATIGNVRLQATSGALTIGGNVSLNGSQLVVDGAGNTLISGSVLDVGALGTISTLADGNYNYSASGENFTSFVDNDGTTSWLLVGRGREGWAFDEDGNSNTAAVNQNLGLPAAFAPANYSDRIINDLLAQAGLNQADVEVRIRRSLDPAGATYQEARWRNFGITNWTWDFDQGTQAGSVLVEHQILSGTGAPFLDSSSGTRDTFDGIGNSDNGNQRIFTWAWGGHNNVQGFSFGGGVNNGANNGSSYLWEFGNEDHAIPYTEIYVRALPAAITSGSSLAKTGTGTLTLTGANTYTNGTTISGGTVLVNNATGSGTGTGAVTVNGGTLGGTGQINGAVTVNTTATITGGTTGTVGALKIGGLTFNGGTYAADLVNNTSDSLISSGPVNVNGGTPGIFSLNASGTTSPATVYKLIENTTAGTTSPALVNAAEGSTISVNGVSTTYSYSGFTGNDFTLTAAGTPVFSGSGALEIRRITSGPTDVLQLLQAGSVIDSRPLVSFANYQLTGSAGNDTLTINYSASGGFFGKDVVFNGGAGFDTMIVQGGSFGRVVYNYTNGTDGSIANYQDASGTVLLSTITYTGLDPITNTGTATNLIFNLPNVANFASLEDAGSGSSRLRSAAAVPTFELTTFVNPVAGGSVTINGGTANDTIAVNSLQPNYAAALTIDAGAGTDIVAINREFAIGGNVFLTGESIQLNRANLNSTTGTVTFNGNVQLGGYGQTVLATNPTTYWRLGETSGTTAVDATGNGNNGTYQGSPVLGGAGALGSDTDAGLALDGVNDAVSGTIPMTAAFTVDLWARSNTVNSNDFGWFASARSANGFIIHPNAGSRQIDFYVVNSGGGFTLVGSVTPPEITGWHHYALSYDPATSLAKIYVDGNLTSSGTFVIARSAGPLNVFVGKDDLPNRFGNGAVDEFAFTNRALTDAEVAQRYQASGPRTFNGTTDVLKLPVSQFGAYPTSGSTNTYQLSVETWFNTTQSGVILGHTAAGGTPGGGSPGGFVPALAVGTDGRLRSSIFWHNGTGNRITSPTALNDGQWHHAVAVYNNGVETLYVDGVAVGSQTQPVFAYSGSYDYYLGTGYTASWTGGNGGWHFYNGQLYEPQVSLAASTPAEIAARFAAGQRASRVDSLVTANSGVTINGSVSSSVAGLFGLNISTGSGTVNLNGNVGSATNQLASLNVTSTGTTTLGGNVNTLPGVLGSTGNVSFSGPVSLSTASTISTVSGNVTFGGTLNGAQALTVNSTGTTTFLGAVGAVTPLTSLTTNAGGTTSIRGGSLTTTGGQAYGDNVTIGGPTTTLTSTGGANITFAGSIENATGAAGLVVNAGNTGNVSVTGVVGSVTPLASISVTGNNLTLSNNVFTSGNVSLTGRNQISVDDINAGSGLITIAANTDGAGAESFLQVLGTAIVTSNNTAAAIGITVGGTGNASVDTLTAGTTTGAVSITVGGTILDLNAATNNITAAILAATAVTGIKLETTVSNVEARTTTGNITLSNTGAITVGNASATLDGLDVTGATGDISLIATGTINVILQDEDISGPANITLNALGAASDVNTSGSNSISTIRSSGATSLVSLTAGRDVNLGAPNPAGYGDTLSGGNLLVTAGRDFVLQQDTFLDVQGPGTNTVIAGRDIVLFNDASNSRLTTQGGVITLTANRDVIANVVGSILNTIDTTQGGSPGANIFITATTGNISLGDGVNAGTANVRLSAAGAIADVNTNGLSRVIGSQVVATAGGGITLETTTSTLAAENTTSGNIVIGNNVAGLLTLANVAPVTSPFAIRNTAAGGAISVINTGSITATGNVSATDAVTLTTIDTLAGTENISVPGGVSLSGSSLTLNSGDDVTVAGTLTATTTTIAINVDLISADPALGGIATLTGSTITTPAGVLGGTFLTGNLQADSFILNPQTTTEFFVVGDDPTTAIGDTLKMTVTGLGATLSAPGSVYSGNGSGDWTFGAGQRDVHFGTIETLDITGQYHLAYNNDVTRAGTLVVLLNAGGALEIHSGSAAGPTLLGPISGSILSLTVNGNTQSVPETVIVDDVRGLPLFASSPVGSPNNLNVPGTIGLLFNGNGGTNTLSFNLSQASTAQVLGLGDGVTGVGADGNAEVQTTSGAQSLGVYGTSLASITRTATGATPGSLTIIAEGGNDDIDVTANGVSTDITAANYASFNFSAINTYGSVTILAGDGQDNVQLNSLGGGTSNVIPFMLDGGNADDVLGIGNTLATLGAQVTVAGGAGSDVLNVDNSGSATAQTNVIVREDSIDNVTGRNATGDVLYGAVETLNVLTSTGNDTIRANFDNSPGGTVITATINGSGGNDQLFLDAATTPALDFLNLQGGAGNDTFGTAPSGPTGAPVQGNEIVPVTGVQIVISGESSSAIAGTNPSAETDQLNLNISSFATAEVIDSVTGQVISIGALPAHSPLYFNGVEDLNVFDGNVLTNTAVGDLYLRSTNDSTSDNILFYRGGNGLGDVTIMMNDRIVNRLPFRPTSRIVAYGRGGNDAIQLNFTAGTVSAEFHGEDGQDDLLGSFQGDLLVGGAQGDHLIGMDGNDVLWGDQQALTWATRSGDGSVGSTDGNDTLEGTAGNDFIFGGGGNDRLLGLAGNDYLHGGFGNDSLVGAEGNDFLRAGDGNDEMVGDDGNDITLAGTGDDFIYGSFGRDFQLGGDGSDRIYDLNDDGEDVNVTETNSYDIDLINPAYDPNNPLTFFGPNDVALLNLMLTWTTVPSFATRAAAAKSLLFGQTTNDSDADFMFGNMLAPDYSIYVNGALYYYSTGDMLDPI